MNKKKYITPTVRIASIEAESILEGSEVITSYKTQFFSVEDEAW